VRPDIVDEHCVLPLTDDAGPVRGIALRILYSCPEHGCPAYEVLKCLLSFRPCRWYDEPMPSP